MLTLFCESLGWYWNMPDFLVENTLLIKPYHFSLFSPLAQVYLTCDHYDIIYEILQMKRQSHKMVKHTKKICRLLPRNCLSVLDHFAGLTLKRANTMFYIMLKQVVIMQNMNQNYTKESIKLFVKYATQIIKNRQREKNTTSTENYLRNTGK